jgi:hypothetical protein
MQAQIDCSQTVYLDLIRAKTRYAILKHDIEIEHQQSLYYDMTPERRNSGARVTVIARELLCKHTHC